MTVNKEKPKPSDVSGDIKPISCMSIFESCMVNGYANGTVTLCDMEAMRSASMDLPSIAVPETPPPPAPSASPHAPPPVDITTCELLPDTASMMLGATAGWPALQKWNLDYFRQHHGDLSVSVTHVGGKRVETSLAAYLDSFPQIRLPAADAWTSCPGQTPYLRGWFFEKQAPELLNDFTIPAVFQDWFEKLPPAARPPFHWIFLGPRGSCTPLHIDPTLTHAWLAQLYGRKRFILFPPSAVETLRDPRSGQFVDPVHPDLESFPRFDPSRALEVVLEPGDMVYIPPNWAHHVTCIDDSISLTYNFLPKEHFPVVRNLFLMKKMAAVQRQVDSSDSEEEDKEPEAEMGLGDHQAGVGAEEERQPVVFPTRDGRDAGQWFPDGEGNGTHVQRPPRMA